VAPDESRARRDLHRLTTELVGMREQVVGLRSQIVQLQESLCDAEFEAQRRCAAEQQARVAARQLGLEKDKLLEEVQCLRQELLDGTEAATKSHCVLLTELNRLRAASRSICSARASMAGRLTCCICYNAGLVPTAMALVPCGHVFCPSCGQACLSAQAGKVCPVCRTGTTSTLTVHFS
jgi:hypothetical protein